jgi:hypothetical protein
VAEKFSLGRLPEGIVNAKLGKSIPGGSSEDAVER